MKIKSLLVLLFSATFFLECSAAEADVQKKQMEIGKLYYQNLLDNRPEESYELLSSKDKESFSKEQFSRVISMKTAILNKDRVVTIKGATIEESGENMAVVKVLAELSSPQTNEVKNIKATQLLLKEEGEWKIYSAHTIVSVLMQAKAVCDSDTPLPKEGKEDACYVYYGTKEPVKNAAPVVN